MSICSGRDNDTVYLFTCLSRYLSPVSLSSCYPRVRMSAAGFTPGRQNEALPVFKVSVSLGCSTVLTTLRSKYVPILSRNIYQLNMYCCLLLFCFKLGITFTPDIFLRCYFVGDSTDFLPRAAPCWSFVLFINYP